MNARIDVVDAAAFAPQAAQILNDAWPAPALHYTPEYVRWQLTFPGNPAPVALAAYDDSEAIGFIASTPRRMRLGPTAQEVAVVSFVAVLADRQRRGIAAALYARLLSQLQTSGPLLTFAVPDSSGERALLRAYSHGGYTVSQLGSYPTFSYLDRSTGNDLPQQRASSQYSELNPVIQACARDGSILWSDPSAEQFAHYLADPRSRRLLVVCRASETGAAWALQMAVRTARSVQTVTALETLYVPGGDGGSLPQLLHSAAGLYNARQPARLVNVPNAFGLDARRFGLRQTGVGFRAYLCTLRAHPFQTAAGTNLEIT